MPKFNSSVSEDLTNEEPTVAIMWVSLAADQGDAVAARSLKEALDGSREGLPFGHRTVERMALGVVMILTCGPPSKLLPQEQIAHPTLSHRDLKLVAVEVRRVARVRKGPHIDQELDLLAGDEPYKLFEPMIRVAYGPDSGVRRHDSHHVRDSR
jgi:hypothetical protein